MISNINFSGLSNSPSDYESPDGELLAAMNLVPEDGVLKPALKPKIVKSSSGKTLLYIHKAVTFTHFIFTDGRNIFWQDEDSDDENIITADTLEETKVSAIGNTLLISIPSKLQYAVWDIETSDYNFLDAKPPELTLSFGLNGNMVRGEQHLIAASEDIPYDNRFNEFSEANKNSFSQYVLAEVNKFINEKTSEGYFLFPFFVRYAYRMYDNSTITMDSAPILMCPSTQLAPVAHIDTIANVDGKVGVIAYRVSSFCAKLDVRAAVSDDYWNAIEKWKDLIKSVDVFISAPIYSYDQSGQVKSMSNTSTYFTDNFAVGIQKQNSPDTKGADYYQKWSFAELYCRQYTFSQGMPSLSYPTETFSLPRFSLEQIHNKIKDCSTFYLLKSLELKKEAFSGTYTFEPEEDYLNNIVTKETIPDDYFSHDILSASYMLNYNSRLNMANVKRHIFDGFTYPSMVPYTNGEIRYVPGVSWQGKAATTLYTVWVYIREQKEIVVKSAKSLLATNDIGSGGAWYFFYPNPNAYKMQIAVDSAGSKVYEFNLSPHDYLNGAYAFIDFSSPTSVSATPANPSSDKTVIEENKLYTSNVNNPFFFPVSGVRSIGLSAILGISTATKALSEGQYGQYPLYVFSGEGVWALSVASDGSFASTPPPVRNDVCINPKSITPIDSGVLFVTDKGLMFLLGSDAVCLTEILDGPPADVKSMPYFANVTDGVDTRFFEYKDIRKYLSECELIYDYKNQRIITAHYAYRYSLVFSMKSKKWGVLNYSLVRAFPFSYPKAYAESSSNEGRWIVDLTDPDESSAVEVIAFSRAIKLDMPDVLKTIDTVILRGTFKRGDLSVVLYGSRDMLEWHLVKSSTDNYLRGFSGTPYKYFRLAFVGRMNYGQNVTSISISFKEKYNNKLR